MYATTYRLLNLYLVVLLGTLGFFASAANQDLSQGLAATCLSLDVLGHCIDKAVALALQVAVKSPDVG